MKFVTPAIVLFAALSGCAGDIPYRESGPTNLVTRESNVRPLFSGQNYTNIAVFTEAASCEFEYVGTIVVNKGVVRASLPVGERISLKFNFDSEGLFSSDIYDGFQMLFTAQPNHQYAVEMQQGADGHSFELYDITNGRNDVVNMESRFNCR